MIVHRGGLHYILPIPDIKHIDIRETNQGSAVIW